MHDNVKIVELAGQWFWTCGCGSSSNRGFPRETAARLAARTTRHGSD